MAAKYTTPQDVQIRALDEKKREQFIDLMAPGPGIPWEDRGSVGVLGGFFRTAFSMMFAPVKLLSRLRRPETTKDADVFTYGIGIIWILGMVIQSAFDYFVFYRNNTKVEVDTNQYMLNTGLEAVAVGVGAVVLCRFISILYFKSIAIDMSQPAPPVLAHNVVAYASSPSLLALIPGSLGPSWPPLGAIAALVWMLVLWCAAARGRLRVRPGGAVVGPVLTFVVCCAVIAGASLALWAIWTQVLNDGSVTLVAPPAKTGR
jgi:hypothetical protein